MPQASKELQDKFPGLDQEAFEVLKDNFVADRGGIIHPKVKGYKMTQREDDAIEYLFREWDYGYSPEPLPTAQP